MNQHQTTENNAPDILKKKIYHAPVLTILGKVNELTTGGSMQVQETGQGKHGVYPDGRL